MFALALAATLVASDPLLLVKQLTSDKQAHFNATVQKPFSQLGQPEGLAPIDSAYGKFFKGGGKQPLRRVFAVDRNGDGVDEIAVVREKTKKHRLGLFVFDRPHGFTTKQPKPIASTPKTGFADSVGDLAVTAIGRIDLDGDGTDELALVQSTGPSSLVIEVRSLPSGKNQPLSEPLAVATLDTAAADSVVALCGLPLDGAPGDELVLVSKSQGGLLLSFHTVALGAPAPLSPALAQSPLAPQDASAAGMVLADAEPIRLGQDNEPGLLLRFVAPSLGATGALATHLERRPCSLATPLGAGSFATDFSVGGTLVQDAVPLRDAVAVVPPPPPEKWWMTFGISALDQSGQLVDTPFFGVVPLQLQFVPGGAVTAFYTPDGSGQFDVEIQLPAGSTVGAAASIDPSAFSFQYVTTDTAPPFEGYLDVGSVVGGLVPSATGPFAIRFPAAPSQVPIGGFSPGVLEPNFNWVKFEKAQ